MKEKDHLLYGRWLESRLPSVDERTLVLITGARQTGKTTLARGKYSGLEYFNLDAMEIRDDLTAVGTYDWARSVGKAVVDEAQKLPSVFEKIKYAFDDGSLDFSVLLGSSQILLGRRISETLAGRVLVYELYPLMLSELTAAGDSLDKTIVERILESGNVDSVLSNEPAVLLGRKGAMLRAAEETLLNWGGMPGLYKLEENRRWDWLRSYEVTYLERDLVDLARLNDLQPFRRFQRLSALRTAELLTYSGLARDASLSVETARRYLEYLRLSYQVMLLPPYSRNLTSRLVKSPKAHWLDPGIWRSLTHYSGPVTGQMYESWVVSEVFKLIRTRGLNAELTHYRTVSGMEVDLLMEFNGRVFGIEVKSSAKSAAADASPMRRLAQALGDDWGGGLVVNRGRAIEPLGDTIWSIPACRFLT